MVQLKSFKYLDHEFSGNDCETNSRSPASTSINIDTTTRSNDNEEQQEVPKSPQLKPPSSSASRISSASSRSGSGSISGGNLTAADESAEAELQQVINRRPLDNGGGSPSTTLSTNEEYQAATFDIIDEETTGDENQENDATNGSRQTSAQQQKNTTSQRQQTRRTLSKSPHAPQNKQQPSPPLPLPVGRLNAARLSSASPALSQRSAHNQSPGPATTNHFEIRWRNVCLSARKSKVPRIIADNPLYKLLKSNPPFGTRNSEASEEDKIYYSPPLGNRRKMADAEAPLPVPPARNESWSSLEAAAAGTGNRRGSKGSASSLSKADYRPILTGISGSVFSGQLTAILGPSGVGKTSLLNSLTGRNTLHGTGRVHLLGGASKRMSVVTVPQADVLPEKLTALEDLRFTSMLKNPGRNFDHEANIKRIVRHLQMEKFLNTRIDKLSGGEARRLSIGRELLNSPDIMILDEPTSGLDANTCKRIISALRDIVEHSDHILDRPMAIIVTIHQPQQEVLNLFHRLYVMALGGCAIYEGPPSNLLPHLLSYSSLAAVTQPDQLNENPAIVAIEVASGEFGQDIIGELAARHESNSSGFYGDGSGSQMSLFNEDGGGQSPYLTPRSLRLARKLPLSVSPRVEFLSRARGRGAEHAPVALRLAAGSPTSPKKPARLADQAAADRLSSVTSLSYASTYDADLPEQVSPKLKVDKRLRRSVVMRGDFLAHTYALMRRCWLLTTRDGFLMSIRILGFLLVAGGIVQIFSHALDPDEHQCPMYQSEVADMQEFMAATRERLTGLQTSLKQSGATHLFFFHLILCITIVTSALTGLVFPLQMRMFTREYKNGWYSPAAFITSQTLAELPIDIIGPSLCLLIIYPLCNQPASPYFWREAAYILATFLASIITKSQAQIVGAFLMNSVENSVFLSCVVVTPPALLSGIAVRVSQMSQPLQWLSYGSFLRYTFESLFVIRYGYNLCPCDPEQVHGYPIVPGQDVIPSNLNNFARGILDLNNVTVSLADNSSFVGLRPPEPEEPADEFDDNLFVRYIRLVTDASNYFVPKAKQLGTCDSYRSLYLLDMGIEDRILLKWFSVLVAIFLLSRFITYFVIKTVIKNTHQ